MTRLDRAGACLLSALAAWTAFTGLPRAPGPTTWALLLLAGVAAAFVLGRRRAADPVGRTGLPLALAGAVLAVVVLVPGGLSGGAGALPLGYANANGALLVLAAGAALMSAAHAEPALRRRCLALLPVAVACAVLTGSRAATLACLLVALSAVAPGRQSAGRLLVASAALLAALTTAGAVVVGLSAEWMTPLAAHAEDVLPGRPPLWGQAVELTRSSPVVGTAPGGFAELAPAAADADLRWAHSLLLQQAAETGLVGAGLLLVLLGWAFARLWVSISRNPAAVPAAVLLGGLLVQASIDYTAHFPVVTLATAALLGVGTADARAREPAERA